jgi:hypothetical protein
MPSPTVMPRLRRSADSRASPAGTGTPCTWSGAPAVRSRIVSFARHATSSTAASSRTCVFWIAVTIAPPPPAARPAGRSR